jgi:hypothetical protein
MTLIVTLAGCGRGGPVTHPVQGTITYNGKPVAEAQVGFVPTDAAGEMKPARGKTDANGHFELKTYLGPGDDATGAMAGGYKVTVEKGLPQNKVITYDDLKNFKPELPVSYADAQKTTLTADVKPTADNDFKFTLEDAK